MSRSSFRSRFTAQERRDLALEYLALPHGSKGPWLRQRSIDPGTMKHWRAELTARTFEGRMIPRGGVIVSAEENREMGRLHQENEELRAELARLRERDEAKDRVIDALGKAIGLLQDGPTGTSPRRTPGP